ncbi:hypothetical protein [Streptobacillus notomytis]|uniref:hypothetical protein n=2 Tax=Streptobacillus notomytis TaxID=1712031 RepID=UPI0009364A89|nr:hypothetical protein [Streptobacillus notomytis]
MDICIFKIKYSTDPTKSLNPHQHFIGYQDNNLIIFYSISSILKKEYKVYPDGEENPNYYILDDDNYIKCNFKVPSFINYSEAHSLMLSDDIDITKLDNRNIDEDLKKKILKKIEDVKKKGNYTEYSIDPEKFKKYNPKCSSLY